MTLFIFEYRRTGTLSQPIGYIPKCFDYIIGKSEDRDKKLNEIFLRGYNIEVTEVNDEKIIRVYKVLRKGKGYQEIDLIESNQRGEKNG